MTDSAFFIMLLFLYDKINMLVYRVETKLETHTVERHQGFLGRTLFYSFNLYLYNNRC